MNIEEKIKINLLLRGFDNQTQLNNRGLIGATIDETILEVVKNFRIGDFSVQSEQFVCLCPRNETDNCDRKEPCKECETCPHLRQTNYH